MERTSSDEARAKILERRSRKSADRPTAKTNPPAFRPADRSVVKSGRYGINPPKGLPGMDHLMGVILGHATESNAEFNPPAL
jgi:hypothetical protein